MTAVAIGLTGTVATLVVALLVLVYKYVAAQQEVASVTRERDMFTLRIPGLEATIADRDERVGRLEDALFDAQTLAAAFKAAAISALPDDAVRDIVNGDSPDGLLPFPRPPSGGARSDSAAGEIAVPDDGVAGEPG